MEADPSASVPQMLCCQCQQRMHVYLQSATEDDDAAYYVTCFTEWCVMWGHTFSATLYPPENLAVYLFSHGTSPVLQLYIDLVALESAEAAAAVEQIQYLFGAPAALHAALALTILRMEVRQNHRRPDLGVYAYLIRDYPAAVPLLIYAMHCCLNRWKIDDRGLARSPFPVSVYAGAEA
jgi:hypothetical protein